MIEKKEPERCKAADILEAISRDERNRAIYEAQQKQIRDEQARLIEAKQRGFEEGFKIGFQEEYQKVGYTIARKLLKLNMEIDEISDITGLSPKEIQTLPMNE